MPLLEVPGARLSYRKTGSGPILLLVPGAGGSGLAFVRVAKRLAAHYSVVRYDRRGFSRSRLDQPPDPASRLAADADDAAELIEHLGGGPAAVLGESSGALVALELLTRHPCSVHSVVPFEPPAMCLLPDSRQWIDVFDRVHDTYRDHGMRSALRLFREKTFAETDRKAMNRGTWVQLGTPSIRANFAHWLDYEVRQYPGTPLDLTALKAHRAKIIPAVGRESRGYPCYRATAELARLLELQIAEFPGGHLAHITEPAAFARSLVQTLAGPGHGPSPAISVRRG